MTHEEADHRLAAGWHVDLEEADALCSAQRKRYLRQEQERLNCAFLHSSTTGNPVLGERLLTSIVISTDLSAIGRDSD